MKKPENNKQQNIGKTIVPPKENKKSPLLVAGIAAIFVAVIGILGYFAYSNGVFDQWLDAGQNEDEAVLERLKASLVTGGNCNFEEVDQNDPDLYIDLFLEQGCTFQPGVDIVRIGDEVLTTDDFNNHFFMNEMAMFMGSESFTDEQLLEAYKSLKQDSILFQEYGNNGNEFAASQFTTSERDSSSYRQRNEALRSIEELHYEESGEYIRGEVLTIWFYNMLDPYGGYEEGQIIAKNVMEYYKQKIDSGDMTFEAAAEEIVLREELRVLDPSIDTNVYRLFESSNGLQVFADAKMNEVVMNTREGHVSDMLLIYDNSPQGEIPAYYALIHVIEKQEGGTSLDQKSDNSDLNNQIEVIQ